MGNSVSTQKDTFDQILTKILHSLNESVLVCTIRRLAFARWRKSSDRFLFSYGVDLFDQNG